MINSQRYTCWQASSPYPLLAALPLAATHGHQAAPPPPPPPHLVGHPPNDHILLPAPPCCFTPAAPPPPLPFVPRIPPPSVALCRPTLTWWSYRSSLDRKSSASGDTRCWLSLLMNLVQGRRLW
jgi:hypothetical protein